MSPNDRIERLVMAGAVGGDQPLVLHVLHARAGRARRRGGRA
jgi:hypothetical protein